MFASCLGKAQYKKKLRRVLYAYMQFRINSSLDSGLILKVHVIDATA
jgi:hypothetical protein